VLYDNEGLATLLQISFSNSGAPQTVSFVENVTIVDPNTVPTEQNAARDYENGLWKTAFVGHPYRTRSVPSINAFSIFNVMDYFKGSEEKALFPIRNGARVYMMGMGKNEQGHSIIEWCLSWVPKHPTVFSFCVDHNK